MTPGRFELALGEVLQIAQGGLPYLGDDARTREDCAARVLADVLKVCRKHRLAPLLSSAMEDWETPPEVFNPLEARFRFWLDAAARPETAKAARYFTKRHNALARSWKPPAGCERHAVWLNPPYSRGIGAWMRKARDEALAWGGPVVCLVPNRPGSKWWREDVVNAGWRVDGERQGAHVEPEGGPFSALLRCEEYRRYAWTRLVVEVVPLAGRVRFLSPGKRNGAPFPSALIVYSGGGR